MSAHLAMAQADRWQGLRAPAVTALLGLVLLGLAFRQEAAAALAVWNASTAYNHCFLVLPIAAWLAYERRGRLPGVTAWPLPWAVLLVVPLGAVWLLSERLGIMEGRQFAALGCIELLMLVVLGWRMVRAFAAPLAYLVFLVPFGAFLTSPLQDFTAHFVVWGLNGLGIANYSDGHTIEIPEGVFFVAEACAGLRFLIAAVAFGVLYAFTLYRSPVRRVLFVAVSVVVPVLANGVRALGIVAAGHWLGSAEAAAADHLIYGWLFFSAVIMLLILAGLPFRQDGRPKAAATVARPSIPVLRMAIPAVLLAALAAAGPLLVGVLDRAAAAELVSAPAALAGCVADSGTAADSAKQALARIGAVARGFDCHNGLHVLVVVLPPRTNPALILAAQRSLTGQEAAEDVAVAPLPAAGAPGWLGVRTTNPARMLATALWMDGGPAPGGLRGRMQQARDATLGTGHDVVLAVASTGGLPFAAALQGANAAGLSTQLAALSAQ